MLYQERASQSPANSCMRAGPAIFPSLPTKSLWDSKPRRMRGRCSSDSGPVGWYFMITLATRSTASASLRIFHSALSQSNFHRHRSARDLMNLHFDCRRAAAGGLTKAAAYPTRIGASSPAHTRCVWVSLLNQNDRFRIHPSRQKLRRLSIVTFGLINNGDLMRLMRLPLKHSNHLAQHRSAIQHRNDECDAWFCFVCHYVERSISAKAFAIVFA